MCGPQLGTFKSGLYVQVVLKLEINGPYEQVVPKTGFTVISSDLLELFELTKDSFGSRIKTIVKQKLLII